jgi:RND family efflux transporter MFP subunit
MKKNKLYLILPAIALLAWSCGDDEKVTPKQQSVEVKTETVKYTEMVGEHRFSGIVKADDKLMLSTKIFGQVDAVLVQEGDKISKGQLLIKIKSNDLAAKQNTASSGVKAAKTNMENTIKNYDRIKALHEKGSATQKELEDMTAAKEAAIAQHQEAQHQLAEVNDYLSYANLTSPINGFVSKKMVNVGDMANPGQPILALESMEELKIEADIPAFKIGQFEINDSIKVTVKDAGLTEMNGVVERIVPSSSFSGQYKAVIALSQQNKSLKPGMFARINLLKDIENKLLIPKSSIITKGQLTGIYTVNQQGEAMLRWIRLGKEYGDYVEVLSGVTINEQIIVSSQSKITDGILVKSSK